MAAPLAGLRVVCLGVYVPAPLAAHRLSTWGASVVDVEPPAGDPLAGWCPAWYAELHAGHDVRRLDLKRDDDRGTFESLLAGADLLLTSLRPAALARLALDWPSLTARHPRLCHVAIVGFAAPRADEAGHDLTYVAPTGLLEPPALPATLVADLAGAERAASAALALLLGRERGRGADRAEVSLAGSAAGFADPLRHGLTGAGRILGGGFAGYGLYEASDGWVAVAALEPHFWARLTRELGVPDEASHHDLAGALRRRSAREWADWAMERDLPVAAVEPVGARRPAAPSTPSPA
jgi:crotonobetainyl-CoA:carnitine CoA-transferase CaiB-like acyl-CoA transferase